MLDRVVTELGVLKSRGILASEINPLPFASLSRAVETQRAVFVDISMEKFPEADAEIISIWRHRSGQGNALVHMRGNPLDRGGSTAAWQELSAATGYIPPESIQAEMTARGRHNQGLLARAELPIRSAQICA